MSTWEEVRPAWIKRVNNKALLSVIAEVAAQPDDPRSQRPLAMKERQIQSVLWLASRGAQGKEWGHAGTFVMAYLEKRGRTDGTD